MLRGGESDVCAITAEEARIAGFGFFAFELRSDADDGDDDIGFAGGVDGFLLEIGRKPEKTDSGFPRHVKVFELDGIGVAGLEMNERGEGPFAVGGPIVDQEFVVEIEAIAAISAGAETIVAVDGRDESTGPADGEKFGGDVGCGRDIVPFEEDGGVDASGDGRAGEIDVGEEFGGEAGRSSDLWRVGSG